MTYQDSTDTLSECGKALDVLAERMENGGLEPNERAVEGSNLLPWAEWYSGIAELYVSLNRKGEIIIASPESGARLVLGRGSTPRWEAVAELMRMLLGALHETDWREDIPWVK